LSVLMVRYLSIVPTVIASYRRTHFLIAL
jgi:hypothetical protein